MRGHKLSDPERSLVEDNLCIMLVPGQKDHPIFKIIMKERKKERKDTVISLVLYEYLFKYGKELELFSGLNFK